MALSLRWQILAICTIARLAMGYQFQSIASLSVPLQKLHDLNLAQIGVLIGLYLLPGILVAIPGGILGARFGDKRIAALGLGLMALGGVVMALAPDAATLTAGRATSGAGAVLFNITVTKMVTDWFIGRELVLAMSILVNSWPIGIGIALWVFSWATATDAVPLAMGSTALLSLLGLLAVALGYRRAPDSPPVGKLTLLAKSEIAPLVMASLPWMLFNAAYAIFVSFTPGYLVQRGIEAGQAAAAAAIGTLMFVVSVQVGGLLVQRFQRPVLIATIGLVGFALTLSALLLGAAPLVLTVAAGLFGGLPAGVLVSLPSRVLSPASRSTGMGVFYTMFYAGMFVFPGLAGWAAQVSGSPSAPLGIAIAVLVIAALILPLGARSKA